MSMPGLDAVGRPVVGQISNFVTAIVPVISSHDQAEPQLRGTRDRRYRIVQAASGEFRSVFFSIPFQPSWFEALSEPVRKKPRSPAALSPFAFWQPAPSPFVATGWYANLSTPVRIKPGLKASLQPFFTTDTNVIPVSTLMTWFDNLSDPVRIKPGLKASLQDFLAAPSRLLPTPTIFGVLNALETKDTFLAGARVFNRPTSGELGVQAHNVAGELGVSIQPAAISARMSIRTQ